VLDLGGDNHGANPEDNIFAIETPVAIVTLVRDSKTNRSIAAPVNYRRIRGSAEGKLEALRHIGMAEDPFAGQWDRAPNGWLDPLMPPTGDAAWEDMPVLTDLFPWQQPGCMFNRTWPIAPSQELLQRRWERFSRAPLAEKPKLFVTASSGRSIETTVRGLPTLASVSEGDASLPIRRYAYHSFDIEWAFADPRMAKTESPSLWQSQSDKQIFLCSLLTAAISSGPAMTVSHFVPDKHFFRGSYGGKDIIPLYRDASANQPNITAGLPATLARLLGINPPSVEDVAAYVYALLSSTAYQQRFAAALETPGLRVPITADAELWAEAIESGRELLWLHTYADRFVDTDVGRPAQVPEVEGIGWDRDVSRIPEDTSEIGYDEQSGSIIVGDGRVGGVRPEVWAFSVSGMQVISKWLGYRTRKGTGRAVSSTSELDRIRPTEWADEWNDELLDLVRILTITVDRQGELADLLERVCDGPLVSQADLPQPTEAERKPPETL
jgi:hypothetical protein